jgi:ABC-type Fe3+/spermidine/putrescine transport system ATPase subunit
VLLQIQGVSKSYDALLAVWQIHAVARPTNMMFQSYALFPHMSVEQNIAIMSHGRRPPSSS